MGIIALERPATYRSKAEDTTLGIRGSRRKA
jgi:hypothetical protein